MTLLTSGYWHSTYWAENYWQQDYWAEYGTAAPTGGDSALYYYGGKKRKQSPRELLEAVANLLRKIRG